jgi:protein subunit release factor A
MLLPVASPGGAHVFTRRVAVLISRPPDEVFAFVADARTTQKNLDRGFARLKQLLEAEPAA